MIVPSSNTTMETEVPALLRRREAVAPERFTFHSSRMVMKRVSPEEPPEYPPATARRNQSSVWTWRAGTCATHS